MGLGKTVEVMALTLANPPPPSLVAGQTAPCGRILSRATLVRRERYTLYQKLAGPPGTSALRTPLCAMDTAADGLSLRNMHHSGVFP